MKLIRITHARSLTLAVVVAAVAGDAQAAPVFRTCTPTEVGAFNNRVHVRCQSAAEGFVFFAAPSSDADLTNKVLSLGSTAVAFGKRLVVLFDPDDQTSGPQFGCRADDCRPILGIRLLR